MHVKIWAEWQARKTPAPHKYSHTMHPSLSNALNAGISVYLTVLLLTTANPELPYQMDRSRSNLQQGGEARYIDTVNSEDPNRSRQ